jgi:hypothetical protein
MSLEDLSEDDDFCREILQILHEEVHACHKREREILDEHEDDPKRKKVPEEHGTWNEFDQVIQIMMDRGTLRKYDIDALIQLSRQRKTAIIDKHRSSLYMRYSAAKILHGASANEQNYEALSGVIDPTVIKSCVKMRLSSMFPLRPVDEFLDRAPVNANYQLSSYAPFMYRWHHCLINDKLEGVRSFPKNLKELDASSEMGGVDLRCLPKSIEALKCVSLLGIEDPHGAYVWPTSFVHYRESFKDVKMVDQHYKNAVAAALEYSTKNRVFGSPRVYWDRMLPTTDMEYSLRPYNLRPEHWKHVKDMNLRQAKRVHPFTLDMLTSVEVDMFESSALNSLPKLKKLSLLGNPLKFTSTEPLLLQGLLSLTPHCYACKLAGLGARYHTNCDNHVRKRWHSMFMQPLELNPTSPIQRLYLPTFMVLMDKPINSEHLTALSFGIERNTTNPDLHKNCEKLIAIAQQSPALKYLAVKNWYEFSWLKDLRRRPVYLCLLIINKKSHPDLGLGTGDAWLGTRTLCIIGGARCMPLLLNGFVKDNHEGKELRIKYIDSREDNAIKNLNGYDPTMNHLRLDNAPFITKMVLGSDTVNFVYDLKTVVNLEQLVVKPKSFCRLPERLIKLYAPSHYLCIPGKLHHILIPCDESPTWRCTPDGFKLAWRMFYEEDFKATGQPLSEFHGHQRLIYLTVYRIVQPFDWCRISQDCMDRMFPVLEDLFMPDMFKSLMHFDGPNRRGLLMMTGNPGYMSSVEPAALGLKALPVASHDIFDSTREQFPDQTDYIDNINLWGAADDFNYKIHQDAVINMNRLKRNLQGRGVDKHDFAVDMSRFQLVVPSSVVRLEVYSVYPVYIYAKNSHLETVKIWTPCLYMKIQANKKQPKIDVYGPRQWMRSHRNITEELLLQEPPVYHDKGIRWHGGLIQDTFGILGTHTNPRTSMTYLVDYLNSYNSLEPTDTELDESEQNGLSFPSYPISDFHRALRKTCIQNVTSLDQRREHPWGLGVVKNMLYLERCPDEPSERFVRQKRIKNGIKTVIIDERADPYRFSKDKIPDDGNMDRYDYVHQWGYVCDRLVDERMYQDPSKRTV